MSDVYLPSPQMRAAPRMRVSPVGLWSAYLLGSYGLSFVADGLGIGAVVVGAVGHVTYTLISKRAIFRYSHDLAPALKELTLQQNAKAELTLRELHERTRWPRRLRNLTGYHLALALHRQGKHAEAIAELADADRRGGAGTFDPAIASSLALFHAMLGNLESADIWHAEAARRYARFSATAPFPTLLSDVALGLRHGRYVETLHRLDRDWTEIETTMKGELLRPIRVLRAFAVAQAAGPREAAAVRPYVAALYPARAADFEYLATSWPELRDFLHTALPSS